MCQSPDRWWGRIYASHPDHLAAGEAAVCAVYPDARNPFAHPELLNDEGLEPHTVPQLWLAAFDGPDRAVDVTSTFKRKLAALRCHRSQVGDGDRARGNAALVAGARRQVGGSPGRRNG